MTYPAKTLSDLQDTQFDAVIDVRSPAEFAHDHLPGAINLPVLSNEERARVGTIYKQESPFKARKIGAALVFRNAAAHIAGPLAEQSGNWRPLVYCWRGGQRSGSFAWMLREIGWQAQALEGGYRTYRRLINQALHETPLGLRLVQLGGYTGTAKTALLALLAQRGVQILDLEHLANHRGSLLGAQDTVQPSQKMFETHLMLAIRALDPARPVLIEAESAKIGSIILPPSLWTAMKQAPWIEVTAPLPARARYLATAYDDILSDSQRLKSALAPLRYHRGHALIESWEALIDHGDRVGLCESLAQNHYDPAYDKSMRAYAPTVLATFPAADLSEPSLSQLADQIVAKLQTIEI